MAIKTVPHPPYCPDLSPCDFYLSPKLRDCRYETIEERKEVCDEGHWPTHSRGLPWGIPEVVGMVQQVPFCWRRVLRRGLNFHQCTINKSAHTENVWKLYLMILISIRNNFFFFSCLYDYILYIALFFFFNLDYSVSRYENLFCFFYWFRLVFIPFFTIQYFIVSTYFPLTVKSYFIVSFFVFN